ncbi:hypothetical protein SLEP1_g44564 [Rubroshorea leprosula]|uniref:Uncharacterized protein n=1 Tax=Rubroshorea leprosula TaxID=152421 RepID=A0AAV5LHR3_9ROSI|nr:hypothetical protein SLEP1_g44564 [Rubroshorea leprosula]
MTVDQCNKIREMDDSQLVGDAGVAMRGEGRSLVEIVKASKMSLGKRWRGQPPRSQGKITALTMPPQRKMRDEEGKEDEGTGAERLGYFSGGDEAVTGVLRCYGVTKIQAMHGWHHKTSCRCVKIIVATNIVAAIALLRKDIDEIPLELENAIENGEENEDDE